MKLKSIQQPAILFFLIISVVKTTNAQYYYKDILNNKEVLLELSRLKEQKIKIVKVTSLEANGLPSEGFFCEKKINKNYTEVEVFTKTSTSYPNTFTSLFSKEGVLQQTTDSSETVTTRSFFSYDSNGRLVNIQSASYFTDDEYGANITEKHSYQYNRESILEQLLIVKNNKDTTLVLFMPDENKNTAVEKNTRTGEIYYYYYDEKNRLTDIVHTYNYQKNFFPDYKFEYNTAGLVSQMITTEKEGAYFFTWKYNYDMGLRVRERCYAKEGGLLGSVEYEYK